MIHKLNGQVSQIIEVYLFHSPCFTSNAVVIQVVGKPDMWMDKKPLKPTSRTVYARQLGKSNGSDVALRSFLEANWKQITEHQQNERRGYVWLCVMCILCSHMSPSCSKDLRGLNTSWSKTCLSWRMFWPHHFTHRTASLKTTPTRWRSFARVCVSCIFTPLISRLIQADNTDGAKPTGEGDTVFSTLSELAH